MGGCLADDMGLGKTLQVLTYLELLRKRGLLSPLPALLIAPASLLENWKSEAAKFTPGLRLKLLHNSALVPGELDPFRSRPGRFSRRKRPRRHDLRDGDAAQGAARARIPGRRHR